MLQREHIIFVLIMAPLVKRCRVH